jgi:hypothetical protein
VGAQGGDAQVGREEGWASLALAGPAVFFLNRICLQQH